MDDRAHEGLLGPLLTPSEMRHYAQKVPPGHPAPAESFFGLAPLFFGVGIRAAENDTLIMTAWLPTGLQPDRGRSFRLVSGDEVPTLALVNERGELALTEAGATTGPSSWR